MIFISCNLLCILLVGIMAVYINYFYSERNKSVSFGKAAAMMAFCMTASILIAEYAGTLFTAFLNTGVLK